MERLGKYEIEKVLGKGAMGLVYKGFDPVIGRQVAIKTVLKGMIDPDLADQLMTRFRNEARAAGRLMHPNIVSIYEYGEDEKNAFIVMEFVEGHELREYLAKRERVEIGQVYRIMSQLLSALEYAHERNVIHRDIKPSNLMLTANGRLKVGDFGIARIDTSTLTMSGTVIGTPAYMSPEQCLGRELDRRSDLFSAGIVLYELMTGVKPFSGALESIAYRICNEDPPLPSRVSEIKLPPALDEIVARALAKEPDSRFQTASEFNEALRRAVDAPASNHVETSKASDAGAGLVENPRPRTLAPDDATLRTIERELALILGPVAKVMVKRAAAKTDAMDELYSLLAENISDPEERLRFVEGGRRIRSGSSASVIGSRISSGAANPTRASPVVPAKLEQEFVDATAARLIMYLGPMAKVVAKRAAPLAKSRREFARMVADYLPADKRALFLSELGYPDSD